jgi:redox-sensitive bicupin YhaK (pirin superfamily)
MFPLVNQDKGNPMELFQIWLNLPKKAKFVEPHFKMLWEDSIPVLKETVSNGKSVEVDVIAGSLYNYKAPPPTPDSWAANPQNEVTILTIKLEAGASWVLPKASKDAHRTLYFYKGKGLKVDGETIPANHSIQVKTDNDIGLQAGSEDCFLLMLQGKPINEPVVQYGPFVMNSEDEIREAFQEYKRTQFGGWPWPKHEQAHERNKERFAIYADGREEIKSWKKDYAD